MNLALEVLVILALMVLNGVLAMSELALVSSRRSRLEQMFRDGNRGAGAALKLIDDPSKFLATVQIGITLVAIIAGAFGGATFAGRLGPFFDRFPIFQGNGEVIAIVITIAMITYLSLVIGELVPKRIALANPELTAATVAPAMRVLSRAAAPAVWLLRISTEFILSILRLKNVSESTITEDEIKALIAEGTQAGVFAPKEREMIEGVLRLADRSVRLVMAPRTDVVWIDRAATREEIVSASAQTRHSRILVCDGSIDDPMGFVHAKDLLGVIASSAPFDLGEMVEPPLAVHERTVVLRLLDLFRRDRVHVALVVDEYGTVQGLVTVTDVLEAIAGDLPEGEEDAADRALVSTREDGSWLIDGMLPIDEFETLIGNPDLVQEREFDTVAGLVLDRLGHLPEPGEKLRLPGLTLEVVDMDGRRIDTVLVSKDKAAAEGE